MHISGMLGHAAADLHLRRRTAAGTSGTSSPRSGRSSRRRASLIFVVQPGRVAAERQAGGRRPWDAWTLEWATTSPPPSYNFETIPTVHSRRPLWDLKHPDDPDWQYE